MSAQAGGEGSRIAYLDGWRAIAVLMVFGAHVLRNWFGIESPFNFGGLGVYIFFLLSGYIIASLAVREVSRKGSFNWRHFMIRRCLRIMPPLWAYALFCWMCHRTDPDIAGQLMRALSFTCNINVGEGCGWYYGHTWSLAFEEQFYLVFPVLFIRRPSWFAAAGALALAMTLLYPVQFIGRTGFLQIIMLFGLGILYATRHQQLEPWVRRVPGWLLLPALAFPLVIQVQPETLFKHLMQQMVPLCIFIVIFVSARYARFTRLMQSRVMARLGLYSYSIYLWQQLFTAEHRDWSLLDMLAATCAILLISHFSYMHYESVFRRLSKRFR